MKKFESGVVKDSTMVPPSTKNRLVTVREGAGCEEVVVLLHKHRIEKVLVVNDNFELRGLITAKDIQIELFKDEVCKLGVEVGLPHEMVY